MTPKELEDSLIAGGTMRGELYLRDYPVDKRVLSYCDYILNCKRYNLKKVIDIDQFDYDHELSDDNVVIE